MNPRIIAKNLASLNSLQNSLVRMCNCRTYYPSGSVCGYCCPPDPSPAVGMPVTVVYGSQEVLGIITLMAYGGLEVDVQGVILNYPNYFWLAEVYPDFTKAYSWNPTITAVQATQACGTCKRNCDVGLPCWWCGNIETEIK